MDLFLALSFWLKIPPTADHFTKETVCLRNGLTVVSFMKFFTVALPWPANRSNLFVLKNMMCLERNANPKPLPSQYQPHVFQYWSPLHYHQLWIIFLTKSHIYFNGPCSLSTQLTYALRRCGSSFCPCAAFVG